MTSSLQLTRSDFKLTDSFMGTCMLTEQFIESNLHPNGSTRIKTHLFFIQDE